MVPPTTRLAKLLDPILLTKKSPQSRRHRIGQLLPRKQLESASKAEAPHGPHHPKPRLRQIRSPSIAQHNIRTLIAVRSQHTANELIPLHTLSHSSQLITLKHLLKVPIPNQQAQRSRLKSRLGQLRLHQQLAKPHIDLCAIHALVQQRNTRLEPKLRNLACLHTEQRAHLPAPQHSRIAKNIHQQSIRAIRAIQLIPVPVLRPRNPPARRITLPQPLGPLRPRTDRPVRGLKKIPMQPLLFPVDNTRHSPIRRLNLTTIRMCKNSLTQLTPQRRTRDTSHAPIIGEEKAYFTRALRMAHRRRIHPSIDSDPVPLKTRATGKAT